MRSLFKNWTAKLKQFSSDVHGGVAIIYAPMSIILFLAAGVAVDYTRSYMVKKEITRALDAAVLAAGSMAIADEDTMRATAEQYFEANLTQKTKDTYNPQVNVVVDGDQITVSSSVNVETSLMKLAHVNNLPVGGESIATRALTNVEIALVLDNTGSMSWDGKMTAMKNAANQLITTMYEPSGSENFVKFAIVPFTGSVNLGVDQTSTWLDTTWVSDAALEDFPAGYDYWGIGTYTGMTGWQALVHFDADWQGCVRARKGQAFNEHGELVDLDISDISPDAAFPNTLWAPYIKPVHNWDWFGEKPWDSFIEARLEYDGGCPATPIQPLYNDKDDMATVINSMVADGGTVIPTGLAWGWRVLSDNVPFTEGAPSSDASTRKVIVLLTDGINDVGSYYSSLSWGYYSTFGMPGYNNLGTSTSAMGDELDDKVEALCDNIKAQGILIYTITFQLDDETTQNLMRNCATRDDMYYDSPTNESLADAFDDIATGLQKLRLAK